MTLASSAERVERADDSFDFALAAASRSALREGERERERERRGKMDKTAKNESLLAGWSCEEVKPKICEINQNTGFPGLTE